MYTKSYKTVSGYINSFSGQAKDKLLGMQKLLNALDPKGEEVMRYGIPTIQVNNKNLVHYGVYKSHFSFYPTPSAIKQFKEELHAYETAKGTIRFVIDKPLPKDLITKIVNFRLQELSK